MEARFLIDGKLKANGNIDLGLSLYSDFWSLSSFSAQATGQYLNMPATADWSHSYTKYTNLQTTQTKSNNTCFLATPNSRTTKLLKCIELVLFKRKISRTASKKGYFLYKCWKKNYLKTNVYQIKLKSSMH